MNTLQTRKKHNPFATHSEVLERMGSKQTLDLRSLSDRFVYPPGFDRGNEISISAAGSAQLYRRFDDGFEIVVKLFGEFDQDKD
jgi:hypothetical protein